MTEKVLLQAILDFARTLGFLAYHTFDSRRSEPGFPDIVAVGHGHMLLLETKTETGKVTQAQIDWLDALAAVSNERLHVRVVRPADYDDVIELMQRCREEGWAA